MVLPLLAGLGLAARFLVPRAIRFGLPIVKTAAKFIKQTFFRTPIRTAATITGIGFLQASPTAFKAVKKALREPTRPGKILGARFETAVTREIRREPKGKVQKALEIGGTVGIIGAGAILAAKVIQKKRAAAIPQPAAIPQAAAVTVPTFAAPAGALVPSPAGALPTGALPAAIEAPTAIKEPIKKPLRIRKRKAVPSLNPVFINQIQIGSTE